MSDLIEWLTNTDEVSQELVDFHVKLLRKLKRSVNPEKWERAIVKFCFTYDGANDAFEIERFGKFLTNIIIFHINHHTFVLGYLYSSVAIKLRIIKHLLEGQFDINAKFKNLINAKQSAQLRLEPFGKDKDGNVYYCQMDEKANIKIYQENLDEETWSVVASNREELVKLIDELKGNKTIRPFPKDLIDEDSSSNSRPSEKEETKTEEAPVEEPASEEIENSTTPEKETEKVVQQKKRRRK